MATERVTFGVTNGRKLVEAGNGRRQSGKLTATVVALARLLLRACHLEWVLPILTLHSTWSTAPSDMVWTVYI